MNQKNEVPGFQNHIGHKVRILKNAIGKYFDYKRETDIDGLTKLQCSLLHYLRLNQHQDIFQKDIEAAFDVTGATMSNMLKNMEAKGLVKRIPVESDGRLKKIVTTKKALDLEEKAWRNVQTVEGALAAGMSEEEISTFSRLLDKAIQNIEVLNKKMEQ
ncbi:MAG: MarR family transcriptional regulator [Agathobacter sp.]|nr:MarR family transcriptional regulator [Agathobacter sp.]